LGNLNLRHKYLIAVNIIKSVEKPTPDVSGCGFDISHKNIDRWLYFLRIIINELKPLKGRTQAP
jgi:hypothetical protein